MQGTFGQVSRAVSCGLCIDKLLINRCREQLLVHAFSNMEVQHWWQAPTADPRSIQLLTYSLSCTSSNLAHRQISSSLNLAWGFTVSLSHVVIATRLTTWSYFLLSDLWSINDWFWLKTMHYKSAYKTVFHSSVSSSRNEMQLMSDCVLKLCTVISTLRWAVLTVLWIGFCLIGPISLCTVFVFCVFCHTACVSYCCNTVGVDLVGA